jgi:hypothetical protein
MFEFMVLNDSGTTTASLFKPGRSAVPSEAFLTFKNNTIRYSVPSNNSVKLDIVDTRGKVMALLVDGFRSAGDYEAAMPVKLSSGMYIIRLTTGAKKLAAIQVRL